MKKKFYGLVAAAAVVVIVAIVAIVVGFGKKEETDTSNKAIKAEEYNDSLKSNAEIYKKYVTLSDYKGLEVEVDRSSLEVTDEDVQSYIDSSITSFGETETITEGVTAKGDTITLDYSGTLNGEAFKGGTATDTTYTIGSGMFISDLDEGLEGLVLGQEYQIPCKFPESYSTEDLAGKDTIFTVTVHSINKTILPEVTDAWVAENASKLGTEATTVEGYRADVKEFLEEQAADTFATTKYNSIIKLIKEGTTISGYPEKEVESLKTILKENIQSEYDTYATYYSSYYDITDFSSYLSNMYNLNSDEEYEEYALESVKSYLDEKMILTIIAVDNGIEVSADDINNMGKEYADYYGYDDYQAIIDEYGEEMNGELGYEVLYEKTSDFLCENSVEKEKTAE